MNRLLATTIAVLIVLSASVTAFATPITIKLNPLKDSTIIQTKVGQELRSNGAGDIFSGRTAMDGTGSTTPVTSIRRGLIYFDVAGSTIPANATITAVTLTMWDVQGLNGAQTTSLKRALEDWGQGASFQEGGAGALPKQDDVTWFHTFYNEADPDESPEWANGPGGNFSSVVSGSTVVTEHTPVGTEVAFSWLGSEHPQMIADVQDWLVNPDKNFGWGIFGNEAVGQTAKRFRGSGSAFPPELSITYTYEVIPEPSSFVLAALGGIAACLAAVRRKNAVR